jgi:hypothetical protein
MTISAVVSVPSGFNGSAPQGGYIYAQDGSAQGWANDYSPWINLSSGCVTLSLVLPSSGGPGFDPSQVTLIGIQIDNNGTGSTMTADVFNWNYY